MPRRPPPALRRRRRACRAYWRQSKVRCVASALVLFCVRAKTVSGRRRSGRPSPLRELERPPRLGLAVLLALDHAAVAGQEAAALEDAAQLRLEIRQRRS